MQWKIVETSRSGMTGRLCAGLAVTVVAPVWMLLLHLFAGMTLFPCSCYWAVANQTTFLFPRPRNEDQLDRNGHIG